MLLAGVGAVAVYPIRPVSSGVCGAFVCCLLDSRCVCVSVCVSMQVVMYLVDLMQDSCIPVSRVASSCLDVIMDLHDNMAGESGFTDGVVLACQH